MYHCHERADKVQAAKQNVYTRVLAQDRNQHLLTQIVLSYDIWQKVVCKFNYNSMCLCFHENFSGAAAEPPVPADSG